MRRLLAWLKSQLAPTVPAAPRAPVGHDTPTPELRLWYCRACRLFVGDGEYHDCATPRGEG